MSAYVPGTAWVPTSGITVASNATPATVAVLVATDEAALDRTEQFTRPKLVPLGAGSFVSGVGDFQLSFDRMGLYTTPGTGDICRVPMLGLVQGATITSVDVIFLPEVTHAGNPGTPPAVALVRWSVAPDAVPGAVDVVDTATYAPAVFPDYINGETKRIEMAMTHVVDVEGYVYQIQITDESGANALPGNEYIAYRVNYAS